MNSPTYMSDRPSEADALGRSHFAKALSRALLSVSAGDGLVVGIEGSWGSGKSTVIGFVKKHLAEAGDAETKPIVVDFNPWMVSNSGALVNALVTQIAASIQLGTGSAKKGVEAGQKLLGYVGLIKHLKYLKYVPGISWAGNIAEDVAEVAESVGDGAKTASDSLGELEKLLPNLDLSKRKAEVVEALRELDRPIVVFVDDLDRLPADEIRTIVQAIKAVADFPRTTYLLAYDRSVVAAALGSGNNEAAGLAYLEKIVQVAYPIPPLFQHQLLGFATERIEGLLGSLGIQLRPYESANFQHAMGLVTKLSRQPRDVVRLVNRLMLSLPATLGEVNAVDVIVFEALSQRFPAIRESVHRHPAEFVGSSFRGDVVDSAEDYWQAYLEADGEKKGGTAWERHLPPAESDLAKNACRFLFPGKKSGTEGVPEDQLRIADPDRLARYFRMASLESVPEAREMHECLSAPATLGESLTGLDSAELSFRLEWLYNYLPSCVDTDASGCIQKLAEIASARADAKMLSPALVGPIGKLIKRLLQTADSSVRGDCLLNVAQHAPVSVAERSVLYAAAEQGKWALHPEMAKSPAAQIVPDSRAVDSAIAAWSSRVRSCAESGSLAAEPELQSVLFRFAQLNHAFGETYEIVGKICSTEEGLANFLSQYEEGSPFSSSGDFGLIEDAHVLAKRIESSSLKDQYAWLVSHITSGEHPQTICEQAKRMRELARS